LDQFTLQLLRFNESNKTFEKIHIDCDLTPIFPVQSEIEHFNSEKL